MWLADQLFVAGEILGSWLHDGRESGAERLRNREQAVRKVFRWRER